MRTSHSRLVVRSQTIPELSELTAVRLPYRHVTLLLYLMIEEYSCDTFRVSADEGEAQLSARTPQACMHPFAVAVVLLQRLHAMQRTLTTN